MELPHSLLNMSNAAKPSSHNVFQCSSPLQVQHSENSSTLGSPSCSKALSNCRAKFFEVAFLSKDGRKNTLRGSPLCYCAGALLSLLSNACRVESYTDIYWQDLGDWQIPSRSRTSDSSSASVRGLKSYIDKTMQNGRDIIQKLKIPWPNRVQIVQAVIHSHEFHPFYGRLTATQTKAPTPSAHKGCRPPSHPSCRRVGFQTNSRGYQKVYEYAKLW